MNPDELIKWRTERGLVQQDLADLLGVTNVCVSRWESGKRHIPAFLSLALRALKVKKGGRTKRRAKKTKKKGE